MLLLAFIAHAAFFFWVGTALVWFTVDWRVKPLHLRIWRSITWLPWTIVDLVRARG